MTQQQKELYKILCTVRTLDMEDFDKILPDLDEYVTKRITEALQKFAKQEDGNE